MAARQQALFLTIKTEGAILPTDLLQRIVEADPELGGLTPSAYHLAGSEKLTEATSRSWNRLLGAWSTFQGTSEKLATGDPGTKLTREQWLLPLFQELAYGRLLSTKAIEIDGKSYAISHGWNRAPIHLLGCRVDLDRPTPGLAGASRSSPHSLLQELLNRSPNHLWGFVSNGLRLRILRDNASLTRQAYVEFDLEAMMQGEAYSDFVLLWLLCHEPRVEAERPDECWLEKWSQAAKQRGVRALEQLRQGVETAIKALGSGFLTWPGNRDLRERLRRGELAAQDYYRQVLRLVYRLLFLFAAEDRDLLLLPGETYAKARERYLRFYSTVRLRRLASRRIGTAHPDLYTSFRLVMRKLSSDGGCPDLALPALGSFLFSDRALPDVENCDIANRDLLDSVRALARTVMNGVYRSVDYKNLGAEELGSVYESLLELHPRLDLDAATFDLDIAAGHERKTTGSYYTPTSLVECLLDSALNPVLDEAAQQNPDRQGGGRIDAEAAILNLKVVDPACGSGHFLIAAAHRIAKRLASVRTGDEEPSPDAIGTALRDTIGHCVYGVDVNPMAVELCKVNLWLESLEPGKPLSFLEHRIQIGNSLLGTTPRLLDGGIPDAAFQPIEGDLKEACTKWRKVNKSERKAQEIGAAKFAFEDYPWLKLGNFAQSLMKLDNLGDDTIEGVRAKSALWEEAVRSGDYLDGKLLADAWCAAFLWKKDSLTDFPITEEVFRRIERNPHACEPRIRGEVQRLASEYNFFHWHLAFPDVFRISATEEMPENEYTGWNGGFDTVLGNPPWENVRPEEPKFFAALRPDIAMARTSALRKQLIELLDREDPSLAVAWAEHKRAIFAESQLLKSGKMLPLSTEGNLNTYRLFAELAYHLTSGAGRAGMIVQTGMATDESGKEFFAEILSRGQLVEFLDFENREGFFPDVDSRFRFALVTLCGPKANRSTKAAVFGWLLHNLYEPSEPGRLVQLVSADVELFNPFSGTSPVFRSERDFRINRQLYMRGVHMWVDNNRRFANVEFLGTMFDMSRDSGLFRPEREGDCDYVPLYEAKYVHQFDHRYAGYWDGDYREVSIPAKADPNYSLIPRSWIRKAETDRRARRRGMNSGWMMGFRDVASSTNERTAIMAVFPYAAVGNNINLALALKPMEALLLCANINAFALDYACRQKTSGMHVNIFTMRQLPVVPLTAYECTLKSIGTSPWQFVRVRALELSYTAWDLQLFAADIGHEGPPFRWDDDRRFLIRCELDALYFQLYGISRDDASYILDSFPIVHRKDEQQYGEHRTKRVILEIYDAMAEAERAGIPYQTRLDPPPADPRVAHAPKVEQTA